MIRYQHRVRRVLVAGTITAIVLAGVCCAALISLSLVSGPELPGWAGALSFLPGLVCLAVLAASCAAGSAYRRKKWAGRRSRAAGEARRISDLQARLESSEERVRDLSSRLAGVQETERRRIGRELHDEIGQLLTVLKMTLPQSQHEGSAAAVVLDDLLRRVRQLSLDLRPAMLEDLGLVPAVMWLTERFGTSGGPEIRLEHAGVERRFPEALETAAFRIVQEALTNAVRHSRSARITVRLWADTAGLGVQVEDRGIGFNPEDALRRGRSGGLSGMRDRVRTLGGDFTIDSNCGIGTRVIGELPIAPRRQEVDR